MKMILHTTLFSFTMIFLCQLLSADAIAENKSKEPKICSLSQCPKEAASGVVVEYCKNNNSTGTMLLHHSCCLNHTDGDVLEQEVVGLDLRDCSLTTVNSFFTELHSLRILSLESNPNLKLHNGDFKGLQIMEYLSLHVADSSGSEECPGGNKSWTSVQKTDTSLVCKDELNLCNIDNTTCPNNNSMCVLTGPGEMECQCLSGYYGYKCLRQGKFPTASYTIVLCVCVVVLSGLLWCTHRRHIRPKLHEH